MSLPSALPIPGLFITGTDTGVGKTLIGGAICHWFRRRRYRVGVCKIAATGCVHRREGLVSEDAEFLAHCSGTRHPLDVVCPQRFAEALAPAVAAERAGVSLDWGAIDRSLKTISADSDVMIVEGVGGVYVPMDNAHTVLDVAEALNLPTVVVARPGLGTINHTLLTVFALRSRGVPVAGVVINNYPPETPGVVEETNPRAIEKWGKVRVLCLTPNMSGPLAPSLPGDIVAAIDNVDWEEIIKGEA
jgi:dethiobiotin synthetase